MKACIHGARSSRPVIAGKKSIDRMVRDVAMREGWAYATTLSGPGARIVIATQAPSVRIGDSHMALDCYEDVTPHFAGDPGCRFAPLDPSGVCTCDGQDEASRS